MWEYCVSLSCSYALVQFGRYLGRVIALMDDANEPEPKSECPSLSLSPNSVSDLQWDSSYDNPDLELGLGPKQD